MQLPTGGIAREQFLQIRCNSEADSKVWMKEENWQKRCVPLFVLGMMIIPGFFIFVRIFLHALNLWWIQGFFIGDEGYDRQEVYGTGAGLG